MGLAARTLAAIALVAALAIPVSANAGTPSVIRTGGPSAPSDPKAAVVGTDRDLAGKRYVVIDASGATVGTGSLHGAAGTPKPWGHAYTAPLTGADSPGRYRVRVPALGQTSPAWMVRSAGSGDAITAILKFFAWNADGREIAVPRAVPSPRRDREGRPVRRQAPRPDGRLDGRRGHDPLRADDLVRGGACSRRPRASTRLSAKGWTRRPRSASGGCARRTPAPDLFIAQVGRPARPRSRLPRSGQATTPRGNPGIGHRKAYPGSPRGGVGGDIAGKAAAALALAYDRTHDATDLSQARQWYAAGQGGGPSRTPTLPGGFYRDPHWKDSMAGRRRRALPLDRRAHYLTTRSAFLHSSQSAADGTLGVVDSFASFAAADICGALGARPSGARRAQLRLQTPAASSARSPSNRPTTTRSGCRGSSPGARPRRTAPAGRSPGWRLRAGLPGGRARRGRRARLHARPQPVRAQLRGRLRARRPDASPPLGIGVRRCAAAGRRGRRAGPDRPDPRARASSPAAHSTQLRQL